MAPRRNQDDHFDVNGDTAKRFSSPFRRITAPDTHHVTRFDTSLQAPAQMQVLEPKDVIRLLRSEVDRAGGQAAWAKEACVHRMIVNRVLKGQKSPSRKIIKALKLRTVFVREGKLPRSE